MSTDIDVTDVWKSYQLEDGEALPVIEGLSFSVAQHEFVALVGPSGCGKSTLLDLLAGFQRPDSGSITFLGQPVERPGPRGILITQKGSVFPWISAWRNVTFVLNGMVEEERISRARHYLELVGLQDFGSAFPYQLSGGMLQRLELARALVVKPEVLYMDEPFGSLDALARLRMRQELLRIRREEPQTTVLVTHDVDEAIALADRIFVLSERPMRIMRIVEVGIDHPRSMADPRAVALKSSILHDLGAI
ncbi:MAG TPA: ABC transporter ATP-binding protein [Gemmatimonadaceae bacterium]|nr:ABC transporter ATP-binding protein [Gemmatimonadaceae bacterium]